MRGVKPYVSSYAAAAPAAPWDRAAEEALFEGFGRMDLAGLELGYTGRLHACDDAWLIDRLRPQWRVIVSLLPGTMDHIKEDPAFGLASADADGRKRALEFAERACRAVEHLAEYLGRPAAAAVSVHSGPSGKKSLEGFADSLAAMARWDWSGAALLVEHCDANAAKKFLRIEDECAAIGRLPYRLLINWGRSALETRSAQGPLDHIRRAREADLLGGLFFSGVTPEWKDDHAPFASSRPDSLLTAGAARAALKAAGDVAIIGIKIQPLPASLGTDARLAMIADALSALGAA